MHYFKGFNSGQEAGRKLKFSHNLDKGKKDLCFLLFLCTNLHVIICKILKSVNVLQIGSVRMIKNFTYNCSRNMDRSRNF